MNDETKGGRVLMIANCFPPITSSGVFRSLKFAKYLPSFNWKPTVIATTPNGFYKPAMDETQLKELPKEVKTIRITSKMDEERSKGISQQRLNEVLNFLHKILSYDELATKIFSELLKVKNGVGILYSFPCVWLSWAYDVVQYIETNMNIKDFDVVYTTSDPYSDHLVGFYLQEKHGIPWIADYRDQWTFDPVRPVFNPKNPIQLLLFRLENILLQRASCSITPLDNKDLAKMYLENFKLPKEKMVCITNGYDEENFKSYPVYLKKPKKFTLTYSGNIWVGRSISIILQALMELCNDKMLDKNQIQLQLIGYSDTDNLELAKKYGMDSIIVQKGTVSHKKALEANINSDILVLLIGDGDKYKHVYTGKIFDYLRSGRPILAIAPTDGVASKLLDDTGHGKAFESSQIGDIKQMILDEYLNWKNSDGLERFYSPKIKKFERKFLTGQLANIFEKTKNTPPHFVVFVYYSLNSYIEDYYSSPPLKHCKIPIEISMAA